MIDFRYATLSVSSRDVQSRPMGACPGLAQLGSGARFASMNINHCVSHLMHGTPSAAYCRDSHGVSHCCNNSSTLGLPVSLPLCF